jgi:hypothetical protein
VRRRLQISFSDAADSGDPLVTSFWGYRSTYHFDARLKSKSEEKGMNGTSIKLA